MSHLTCATSDAGQWDPPRISWWWDQLAVTCIVVVPGAWISCWWHEGPQLPGSLNTETSTAEDSLRATRRPQHPGGLNTRGLSIPDASIWGVSTTDASTWGPQPLSTSRRPQHGGLNSGAVNMGTSTSRRPEDGGLKDGVLNTGASTSVEPSTACSVKSVQILHLHPAGTGTLGRSVC